ncbi:MAG: zeta toxin family protein, partial [Lysobacter sp.]
MDERRKYELGQVESEQRFRESILPTLLERTPELHPSDKPIMVVVGGQPGAGKSTSIRSIAVELASHGGVIQANVDALREFHPKYLRLVVENDKVASNYTHADAKRWAGMVENYAQSHRYNVMVESLLASPDGMKEWFDDYRQQGYATEVRIVAVNERTSRQSVVERYEEQKADKGFGRTVPHDVHDMAYANVLKTVETIEA